MSVRVVLLLALSLFVAACGNRNPLEVTISRCPAIAVVGDAGTLTRFGGEGRMVDDMTFTASINDVTMDCAEGDDVRSEVTFHVDARAGAAHDGSDITLTYFVVVLKDNSQIVSKRMFDVPLAFNSKGFAWSRQVVTQYIPTIEQARRYNYEVLLGFQLTAEDAVYNMER